MRFRYDPRPSPRRKDPHLLGILRLEYDSCELSGETWSLHMHHVVFRSQGGDDVRANIVCLNETVHERYHRGDEDVRAELAWYVWRQRPDTVAYITHKLVDKGGFDVWFYAHTTRRRRYEQRQ